MKRTHALFALTALFFVSACGMKELNDQEKMRLKAMLGNIGATTSAVTGAVQSQQGKTQGKRASLGPATAILNTFAAFAPKEDRTGVQQQMVQKLAGALDQGACGLKVDMPGGDIQGFQKEVETTKKIPSVRFTMDGHQCPVLASVSMNVNNSEKSVSAEIQISFALQDEELKKINDVQKAQISGRFEAQNWNQLMGAKPNSPVNVSFNGEINGSIHSLKEGELQTYVRMNAAVSGEAQTANMNVETAVGLTFPDFASELKFTVEKNAQKMDTKYFLNGREIQQAEFQEFVTSASPQIMGQQGGPSGSAPSSDAPSEYQSAYPGSFPELGMW